MNTESREQSCEDRIASHLSGRVLDLVGLNARRSSDDDEDRENADQELNELPLSVETERVVKVLLSTGGPADWFEMHFRDEDNEPHRITYHFSDWFDHASVELTGDDFDTVSDSFGWMGEVDR